MEQEERVEQRFDRQTLLQARGGDRRSRPPRGPGRHRRRDARDLDGGDGPPAGARLGRLRQRRRPVDVRVVREDARGEQAAVHVHDERVGRAREDPRGREAGSVPAVRRLGEVLRDERAGAAVGPVADLELQAPEPVHGQGGPVRREAVRHPGRLGLRRDPLPHRQGDAEVELVEPHLRRPLQGQDLVVRRPEHAHGRRASTSGSRIRGTRRTRS